MLAETIAVEVGGALGRGLFKLWLGRADFASDTGSDVGELVERTNLSFLDRRRLKRELEEVTEHVAERLTPFFATEQAGGLPENECRAAAIAVSTTLERGFTDPALVTATDLDAHRLEAALREAYPTAAVDALLAPLAMQLYDVALHETCTYLITMAENLPRFQGQAFSELLTRERSIITKLDEALANLPATTFEQALEFETTYRREIARRFDQLQLFGLSSETEVSRYRLSVAYLTLTASVQGLDVGTDKNLFPEFSRPEDHGPPTEPVGSDASDEEDTIVRVDDVLASSSRLLIRGDAGSGKTTLLQWLAVNAAKRSFPEQLSALNTLTPFVIQLRRYAHADLPSPAQFVDAASSQMRALMPDDWVEEILRNGDALILVDGVDELQASRRTEVKSWLEDILNMFPRCSVIVTSRPPAVAEGWLRSSDFAHCALEPMGRSDVDAFIDHWHEAMSVNATDEDKSRLADNQQDLKRIIRHNAPLRRLATSPLLCAMLCALNRKDEAHLPTERTELYRIALEALVQNRDAARRVVLPDLPTLSLQQKIIVLQDLAYWLVRNGYTDAPRDKAIERVAKVLERIDPSLPAYSVFDGLLQRAGLLREPVDGRVDFIHRTFLEYLAALAIVDHGDVGVLVEHAQDDAWSEIIVLAVGVANKDQRHELIETLLDRGDEAGERGQRFHLLAIACFESAPELDPALATRVRETLARRIPPQSIGEAVDLATAGSLTVNLLEPTRAMRAVEAKASIRTLGLVGTDEALEQISKYGGDRRVTVIRELLRQWAHFDAADYARKVLTSSPLEYGRLVVGRSIPLDVVEYLSQIRTLTVERACDSAALTKIAALALRKLVIHGYVDFDELSEVGSESTLEELQVYGAARNLTDLRGAERFPELTTLDLRRCPGMREVLPPGEACGESLRRLIINGGVVLDVGGLAGGSLEWLDLGADEIREFEAIGSIQGLRTLVLEDIEETLSLQCLVGRSLEWLRFVDCSGAIEAAPIGTEERPLDRLEVVRAPAFGQAGFFGCFGRVQRLDIRSVDGLEVSELNALRPKELQFSGDVQNLDNFPATVAKASIRSTMLSDVEGLRGGSLRELELIQVSALRDLSPLRDIATLETVTVTGLPADADRSALAELAATGCQVVDLPGPFPVWRLGSAR